MLGNDLFLRIRSVYSRDPGFSSQQSVLMVRGFGTGTPKTTTDTGGLEPSKHGRPQQGLLDILEELLEERQDMAAARRTRRHLDGPQNELQSQPCTESTVRHFNSRATVRSFWADSGWKLGGNRASYHLRSKHHTGFNLILKKAESSSYVSQMILYLRIYVRHLVRPGSRGEYPVHAACLLSALNTVWGP